ncbi:MAG: PIG-L family deacetylase [Dorea sp.]|jgi:LmbE family N-acetylglucosaminyl deacetylase|nr:PIG-L family deacetylase [Clostridiales bacterium]MCI9271499.1 PIG-L family deacetylase [Dorea sp.]
MDEKTALKALLMPGKNITYTLPVSKGDTVLVISPHPDDETLGCGGAIVKMLSSSVDVAVVILTGENSGGRIKNISRIRKEEFMKARAVLGYSTFEFLDYPDGQLESYQEKLNEQIHRLLIKQAPKLVLTPYLLDYPIDHQIANIALAQALKKAMQTDIIIGMYEIWTPQTNPNCYLNITGEYPKKRMAMRCYQSQENYYKLIDKAESLSTFRAKLSMRQKVEHMECFKLLESNEYIKMVEVWKKIQS